MGDSTPMSEEKVGVGTALEAMEVQMLRRKVIGTNLVKAMMIGMEAGWRSGYQIGIYILFACIVLSRRCPKHV